MSRETNPPRKSNPFDRDFLESKRKSAKGYACPFCTDIYTQEPIIWRHGLQNHRAFLGDLRTEEKTEEARRQFRQQALDKGYVISRTTLLPHIVFRLHMFAYRGSAAAEVRAADMAAPGKTRLSRARLRLPQVNLCKIQDGTLGMMSAQTLLPTRPRYQNKETFLQPWTTHGSAERKETLEHWAYQAKALPEGP